jgi:hypothetical protein
MRSTTEISEAIHRVACVGLELHSLKVRLNLWEVQTTNEELDPGQRAYARGVRDELRRVVDDLERAIA